MFVPEAIPSENENDIPFAITLSQIKKNDEDETKIDNDTWIQQSLPVIVADSNKSQIDFVTFKWYTRILIYFDILVALAHSFFHYIFAITLLLSLFGLYVSYKKRRILLKKWFYILLVNGFIRWVSIVGTNMFRPRVLFFLLTFSGVMCNACLALIIYSEVFHALQRDVL